MVPEGGSAGRAGVVALAKVGALVLLAAVAAQTLLAAVVPARASAAVSAWLAPAPTYRAGDYARGQALSILPAGENGLVDAAQLEAYEQNGARPAGSEDQLGPYAALAFAGRLRDTGLGRYFDEESFGIPAGQVTATERPNPSIPVVIYRDAHDVPHIYAANVSALAYGAGYAAAQDRLFLMDVLRHYAEGTLAGFLGPSCAFEQMDHDQLLASAYTQAQAQTQLDALPGEYGRLGSELVTMIDSYVQGINEYIAQARIDPSLLPADYAAALQPPQPWQPTDVVYLVSLIGSVATGGGDGMRNAALLQYLDRELHSTTAASEVFSDLKQQNDPAAPTTIGGRFPYLIGGRVDPRTVAMPDNAAAPLTGGPTDTTPDCSLSAPDPAAVSILSELLSGKGGESNALLIPAGHAQGSHPIAVFGPELGYYAPQILMEEDLHAPDFSAEGAAFPGANFLVELGRGPDFAWSATTASTEQIVQRLELICNPSGGPPAAQGTYYSYDGRCLPMTEHTFTEVAVPKAGGLGVPAIISHRIYWTVHGIVQGWSTAGGRPVAVVDQRSTYMHEPDSFVGFLRWNTPSLTSSPRSWLKGVADIAYGFNWLYVDNRNIAYGVSGRDWAIPSDIDPNLPIWGTGVAEWSALLPFSRHPQAIDPRQDWLTSWNNKPAPGFSASDDMYGWGPVQRVQMLNEDLAAAFRAHHGRLSRAEVVGVMEHAALTDLDGRTVLPALLRYLSRSREPAGVSAMLSQLRGWLAAGAMRRTAGASATEYEHAPAIAIMDQLETNLIEALFNPLLAAGGIGTVDQVTSYDVVPLPFVDPPHDADGAHQGDGYYVGWEGDVVRALAQLRGVRQRDPFSRVMMAHLCGAGGCARAIRAALVRTYDQLLAANGTSDVARWTVDSAAKAAGVSMPVNDDIQFEAVGIVGQPPIDWQNRPTFQQVVQFPAHRRR
jgi:acyl-homoserine lactone acylase PvdQ